MRSPSARARPRRRFDKAWREVRLGASRLKSRVDHSFSPVPLLQLSEASLAYGHVPLLDHADLVVEPGEHIGLIGRNGTGKTSLLRVIEGTTRPDDGKVWVAPG